MADTKKTKAVKSKPTRRASAKSSALLIVFSAVAFVLQATTILLVIGMLPTFVARFVDRTRERTKVLSIGFLNFAGVFPFWFEMVEKGHTIENAVIIISNPAVIVMMYGAALLGYIVEWGVVQMTVAAMIQRAKLRMEAIRSAQEDLVRRFGPEVTGELPLDQNGFPLEQPKADQA
jgi:hypothetical protein